MMEGFFDDQYIGCTEEMESLAPEILEKEKMASAEFEKQWNEAAEVWESSKPYLKNIPEGFKDEYGIALLTFWFLDLNISMSIINDFSRFGQDPKSFRYHSLHFYLTRALSLLRPGCGGKLVTVYKELHNFQVQMPLPPEVRFPGFGLFITNNEPKKENGDLSLIINTCFGMKMLQLSVFPLVKGLLIPMNEVFWVRSYDEVENQIIVESTYRKCSYYNCAYLGGTKSPNCSHIIRSSAPPIMKFSDAVMLPLVVAASVAISWATS
ncbi:ecto-ADP-ribosyltransferase 5-like [Engystomops pustulosus]|uniref:ecto-ADP-ribosyltransferase 5-like n=1 Tax=Engystomops pustulosus TaxID=76066 RepID=UPI003AFA0E26